MIPYSRQNINTEDIKSVKKVLRSDFLTQGSFVPKFENLLVKFTGAKYSVTANSATSALHIACLALEVEKGDIVWTSPNTFVASANCALYCGADVDFVDINPSTYNICIDSLETKLIEAKKFNKLPKVIIPVHFSGYPCDMPKIYKLSKKYNFKIIEDASHAIGSKYNYSKKDIKIGSCKHSHITIFSFHPVKIITTGEGGAALTNNKKLANKMKIFRTNGITRNQKEMVKKTEGPWYYQQIYLGFNYRLNDIEAALGISQLKRIKFFLNRRNKIANYYDKKLKNLPINIPFRKKGIYSSYHLYVITLKDNGIKSKNQSNLYKKLKRNGIGVNIHYIPVHTQPHYQSLGFKEGDFPVSEAYYKKAISLPIHPGLSSKEQDYIITNIKNFFL